LAPGPFAATVTNAVYNLSLEYNFSVANWIDAMLGLGSKCESVQEFRQAGQVAAWRGGLAHFREGALAACDELPPDLARLALGLKNQSKGPPLEEILNQLRADRWQHPASLDSGVIPATN